MLTRAQNMILGAQVADAATMGLHWIYDQADIAAKVADGRSPAFFNPPSCPFYQYESGRQSPYGDELLPFIRSFSQERGFDSEKAAEASYDFFKSYQGRLNHVTKAFVENRDAGKSWAESPIEDNQAQGIIKMPLTVARYAGNENLLQIVEGVVGVIHKSAPSLEASKLLALVLERVLFSSDSPSEAIRWVGSASQASRLSPEMAALCRFILDDTLVAEYAAFSVRFAKAPLSAPPERFRRMKLQSNIVRSLLTTFNLQEALDNQTAEDREYVVACLNAVDDQESVSPSLSQTIAALGLSCEVPGALLSAFYIARKSSTYSEAVEANILAGGDNCSRSLVIGGLFGGASGLVIPESYLTSVHEAALAELRALSSEIVGANEKLA